MAKYEIEMELTGFKLKIRGEREDIPVIKQNLQQQLAAFIDPAANIAQLRAPETLEAEFSAANGARTKKAPRARRHVSRNGDATSQSLDWHNDPQTYGVPRQTWKAWQKIIWLLHVASKEANAQEMSGASIAETFNKHFRQAGMLRKNNMPRDLGGLKQRTPALVGDHADKKPITWFLTAAGISEASKLVIEAKGETPSA